MIRWSKQLCVWYVASLLLGLTSNPGATAERLVLVAGGGEGFDGTSATQAKLQSPFGVAFDRSGNLFIVEMTGQRVCKVNEKGILTTIAGTGQKGDGGDGGPALKARFNGMHSLAVTANGDIYLCDTFN